MQRLKVNKTDIKCSNCSWYLDWKWYKHHNDYLCVDCANTVANKLLNKLHTQIEYESETNKQPAEVLLEIRDILF